MRIDMAIDLGTSFTTVYIRGKAFILREPSIVAMNNETKKIISVGYSAKSIIGRAPPNIIIAKPIRNLHARRSKPDRNGIRAWNLLYGEITVSGVSL